MTEYVALLRGINSGQNPAMKMDNLRKIFEDMGFENVSTVIASGNVLFDLPDGMEFNRKELEQKIEEEILKQGKFRSPATIRTKTEIEKLLKSNPFKDQKLGKTIKPHISFLRTGTQLPKGFKTPHKGQGFTILGITDSNVASIVNLGTAKSPDLMKVLDDTFGKDVTTRTWGTVEKI